MPGECSLCFQHELRTDPRTQHIDAYEFFCAILQITSALLTQMGNSVWKERKAAMDEVERMLQAAGFRIQPEVSKLSNA